MALRDFITERRVVLYAGRRFVVTKPTCETIALALSRFGGLILACRGAYLKSPHLFEGNPIPAVLAFFTDGHAVAEVLASCVTLPGGLPGELEELAGADPALRLELVSAIAAVSDLPRIIALLDLDEIARRVNEPEIDTQETPEPDIKGPSAFELIAAGFAERFNPADGPMSVMRWPYEAVMSLAMEILPALAPKRADDGVKLFGRTRAEWEDAGITLETEH